MATLVTLTDYWSVHRGDPIPMSIVVNLDLVKTLLRLPARAERAQLPELPERTQLWFGGSGPDDSEVVFVAETLDEILDAARDAAP